MFRVLGLIRIVISKLHNLYQCSNQKNNETKLKLICIEFTIGISGQRIARVSVISESQQLILIE